MTAVIYTRNNNDSAFLNETVRRAAEDMSVTLINPEGTKYFRVAYDLVVVDINGAEGMEIVLEYAERFPGSKIIWITDDPYFAKTAIRNHIHDFITRPLDVSWFEHSVREAARMIRM
ncbi:MAG: hypothetical protein K6E95_08675 [Lachnospiraceae bacterium]|nr:hypothetical protein [Lachnospiraceae bacterium]